MTLPPLPIDDVLPELLTALEAGSCAVLAAPPGAGKTTRVPVALMGARWATGRVLVLEPRRIAARAAAERMAAERGEKAGETVGYRVRGDARVGERTRVEVVTEGILTRMLQADPSLDGVSAVVFDEIHERSIHSDLGLALALEAQGALRPDLRIVAMSATLDTSALARLMGGAPVVESAGRMHPVETHWLERTWRDGRTRLEDAAAALVARALAEAEGDVLAFLPGAGEIRRVAERLSGCGAAVVPLYGALPFERQAKALAPGEVRRVVLATAIAETSLTVPGVRVVVDCGRARRPETDPATGLMRLVTLPVSRAEADQRRGRAGREAPGVCYRMWTKGEEGALPAFAPPEILTTDLAPLALELAAWGAGDGAGLAFLDPPPAPAMAEARALLAGLGALDEAGRITAHGREMGGVAAHPRLAHMLIAGRAAGLGAEAALIAALVGERDPLGGAGGRPHADLSLRIRAVLEPKRFAAEHPGGIDARAAARIREEAGRLGGRGRADVAKATEAAGALLARAYPDRIGLRREGEAPRYLLSNGRGAVLAPGDPLGGARLLVAADVADARPEAVIRRAAPVSEADLRDALGHAIHPVEDVWWSRRGRRVEARRREMLGAVALDDKPWREVPAEALAAALANGVRDLGVGAIGWPDGALRMRQRIEWLRRQDGALAGRLPDMSDEGLVAALDDWLTPWLAGMRRIEEIGSLDLAGALRQWLGPDLAGAVDRAAPERYTTPLGRHVPIDYGREVPTLSVRVQEMFGTTRHPEVGEPPVPLLVELLSPGRRPVQATRDLPGFWKGTYAEVRKEMRARYPKHPWPEDPAAAQPTARAKARRK